MQNEDHAWSFTFSCSVCANRLCDLIGKKPTKKKILFLVHTSRCARIARGSSVSLLLATCNFHPNPIFCAQPKGCKRKFFPFPNAAKWTTRRADKATVCSPARLSVSSLTDSVDHIGCGNEKAKKKLRYEAILEILLPNLLKMTIKRICWDFQGVRWQNLCQWKSTGAQNQ